jgi:DNA mismatch repair protein MutS2
LRAGDDVLVVDINKSGVVITDPSAGKVFVQVGAMRLKCQIANLQLLPKQKPNNQNNKNQKNSRYNPAKSSEPNYTRQSNLSRHADSERDIRGYSANEGVHEMEIFINDALLANRETVCIIHGRGTGVLRDACRNRLRSMKNVKAFRPGLYGEGEDGVTIVTLR